MSIKQVIVIRKDLNMRKGKMVAQGAHASMAVFFDRMEEVKLMSQDNTCYYMTVPKMFKEWIEGRFTKICVSVNSEQELLDIYNTAIKNNIPCSLIKDAGLTEFKEPTYTAVAIGPAYSEDIDPITGKLSLL